MAIPVRTVRDTDLREVLRSDGVVLVENVLVPDVIGELRSQLSRYEAEVLPAIPHAHYHREAGSGILHQYRDLDRFSPWFKEFTAQPWIPGLAAKAVPWDPVFFYLEVVPKPPGSRGVVPHQDLYTAPVDPPLFLHIWIPLVDINAENGGITFYPGTHKLGLAPHVERPGYSPSVHPDIMERIQARRADVTCKAGAAAIFGGDMIHHSGPNTSAAGRPALVIGIRGRDTTVKSEQEIAATSIARLCRGHLGLDTCDVGDDLRSLAAADPEAAARILAHIAEQYQVRLSQADLLELGTPTALAAAVMSRRDASPA